MKSWSLFVHSLRQVTHNFNGALRVSAVLYLAQVVVGFLLIGGMAMQAGAPGDMMRMGAGFGIGALISLVITLLCGMWLAVGWHRFVLLGEISGPVPTFRGDLIWAYFLRSLGYGLIIIIGGAIWGGIVGFVFSGIAATSMGLFIVLMAVVVYLPVLVVGFRITAALPAAALGTQTPFMAGWNATSGAMVDIAGLAVILIVIVGGLGWIGTAVLGAIPPLAIVWEIAFGWLRMMVGVSILTTLYGHYIEKRALV